MTTDAIFAVFEDFNEQRAQPSPPPVEDMPLPPDEIRTEAWTDGYLAGRLERSFPDGDQTMAAKLLASVYELDSKTSEAGDAASILVADLLLNTIIAVTSDDWSVRLLQRLRLVADRVKPAVTIGAEFLLRDELGTEHRFGELSELSKALEAGWVGGDVSIQWQRGEATMSRTTLLNDLRDAIVPLSVGWVDEQSARH